MQKHLRFHIIGAIAAGLLAACGGGESDGGNDLPPALSIQKVDGRYHTGKQAAITTFKSHEAPANLQVGRIDLPALAAEKSTALPEPFGARRIGEAREIASTASPALLADQLHWSVAADGSQHAAIRVQAEAAFGLRLGLLIEQLPDAALLRLYHDQNEDEAYEVSGSSINALLALNAEAGDTSAAGRTWWSPNLGGDHVVLELELPAGVMPQALQIALPTLSHIFTDLSQYSEEEASGSIEKAIGDAESCNQDVSCYRTGQEQRDAVARMQFVASDGKSYLCTGTLLNDAIASDIPYFLTANHCIGTQAEASSLQTDWFLRTASCSSAAIDSRHTVRGGGARLLVSTTGTQGYDATLLVLNDAAPAGTYLAGWDANQNNTVQAIYGIHHPAGDLAKISGGQLVSYASCNGSGSCSTEGSDSDNYYAVSWASGTTEGGSSGSALFSSSGHVLGTLYGGAASCSAQQAPDFYGRFDKAFAAGMNRYLAASERPL
ncbi:trypsin-like peptidase domain-containing protein [Corticibacter populi]|nr:trypsin-like peptidase domain-containing protein [Corticibacter populi]